MNTPLIVGPWYSVVPMCFRSLDYTSEDRHRSEYTFFPMQWNFDAGHSIICILWTCILYCYSILSFGPWYCFVPLCFRSVQEQRGPTKAKTPLYKYRLSLFVVISMSLYAVNILLWGVLRFPFEPTYSTTGMLSRGFGAGILCYF